MLAVINGEKRDRTPVFPLLMSLAADRYGVSYRKFASNGHILAESQLHIIEMFQIDAITSCSDAFRISADLGGNIVFPENTPPFLAKPLVRNEDDFMHLKKPDVACLKGRMADRINATGEMAKSAGMEHMVLGWVDMPFAEACSICGISEFMLMLCDEPELAHEILDFLSDIVIDFAVAQLEAGAPMIGAGDAAASLLSPALYRAFALPYEQRICSAVHKAKGLAKLHVCGNTEHLLRDMCTVGADLYNVDHMVSMELAADVYGKARKAYKGNMNPVGMLNMTPEDCGKRASDYIARFAGEQYILSCGCEIPAAVEDDVLHAFCNARRRPSAFCAVP